MGQGSYVICEWDSVQKEFPSFQSAFRDCESKLITKCNFDWKPRTFGALALGSDQYGRTTILPALFDDHNGNPMDSTHRTLLTGGGTWRQLFTTSGNMTLMNGTGGGNTIPEDFKIALMGFAFPNKNQHITEIKMQIGDRKYGRINIEEIHLYNKPAIIFEEGYVVDEEEAFDLYGYVEGPIPIHIGGYTGVWQRIVPIGAAYFKMYDKVGGAPGSLI
jgi:hypothetical protein